jgi:hypothetical protein
MNVSQPVVDRHLVNINIIQSSTQVRYINETARTLKIPHTLVLGNHEALNGIEEISINYNSFEEVYDHSSTIVNSNFSTMIAKESLPIQILRPWQCVRNGPNGINRRKQLMPS